MKQADLIKFKLPDSPGVYFFLGKGRKILYIGKATSLKDRVSSYMSKTVFDTRSPLIAKMLEEAKKVEFTKTDSVLEALILEASLIKKHQPFYNSREKDDKSYNYVVVTKEDFPKILTVRSRELHSKLETSPKSLEASFGPFPYGGELKEALKIIRRIFPYRNDKCKMKGRACFNAQIGLCPGPCAGWITKKDYRKNIRHLKLFFEAKKPQLIKTLQKEMKTQAKAQKFEEAEKTKRQIFALEHIQDIALLRHNLEASSKKQEASFRVEAYDIAHISGTSVVGVMTVVVDGEVAKSEYRKFKIHIDTNNDTANLKEVLTRRFSHPEWAFPDLIVVDGGVGQINVAKQIIKKLGYKIEVASVVKDDRHKAREIIGNRSHAREILLANSEAHRFAIAYHRQLRGKGFKI